MATSNPWSGKALLAGLVERDKQAKPVKQAPAFTDFRGTRILVGNEVASTGYGYGTPKGADHGVVVGFGRTNVRVAWDGYAYTADDPYHVSRPRQLRVLRKS